MPSLIKDPFFVAKNPRSSVDLKAVYVCRYNMQLRSSDAPLTPTPVQPPQFSSKRGRFPSNSTLILQKFCIYQSHKSKKATIRIEFLRAFCIRMVKKLIRITINDKRPAAFMIKFSRNRELFNEAQDVIMANIEQANHLDIGSTETDPTKPNQSYKSFNADFVREFYSIPFISKAHDYLVRAILETPDLDHIGEAMNIALKVKGANWENDIRQLQKLLSSKEFKCIERRVLYPPLSDTQFKKYSEEAKRLNSAKNEGSRED